MHYFYILYSLKDGRFYKGYSTDIGKRFLAHKNGQTTSTKNRRPLVLIYVESFESKGEAMAYERWSKTIEGGSKLKNQLREQGVLDEGNKLKV